MSNRDKFNNRLSAFRTTVRDFADMQRGATVAGHGVGVAHFGGSGGGHF